MLHTVGMEVKREQPRSVATREALLGSAQRLFGRRGYANVSIDEIASRASATKGAFYHHFRDKRDLFHEVVERIEEELAQSIRDSISAHSDPISQLVAGCRVFLDACADPRRAQITLIDAPAVLGWHVRREIDARHGLGILASVLQRGMKAGRIQRQPVKPLAHLILGAALEGGMLIAQARSGRIAEQVRKSLLRMLEQLAEGSP